LIEEIFLQFGQYLDSKGLIINEGKMVNASFAVAPCQGNTCEKNLLTKKGKGG
jgi:hypothetical protein